MTVAIIAVPDTAPAVLYGLSEVFSAVGVAWTEVTGDTIDSRRMVPEVVAEAAAPFTCEVGAPVVPRATFHATGARDVVIVPDLALRADLDPRGRWSAAVAWLREQYAGGAVVCSVCTGSLMLAEAALLDGLEATTHWAARPHFRRFYPAVALRPERVLVPAGPEHRIITAGGHASWAELALYLVARFCGRDEAIRIAKLFLLGDRSDGQLPFAAMLRPARHGDAAIERCQVWIAHRYADPNPVAGMQMRSGLAPRTFKRRFRAATGYGPIEYVQTLRIEEAKHLLETTSTSLEEIAAAVGYRDPTSFRRVFTRMTGVTPARYRKRFRGRDFFAYSLA